MRLPLAACLAVLLLAPAPLHAETALIAVATNFAGAAEALAADYGAASGDTVTVTAGATGKLYAQISAGAPFDAFLSADTTTPARLEADGTGVAGTAFPYATGTLVLWSADNDHRPERPEGRADGGHPCRHREPGPGTLWKGSGADH